MLPPHKIILGENWSFYNIRVCSGNVLTNLKLPPGPGKEKVTLALYYSS